MTIRQQLFDAVYTHDVERVRSIASALGEIVDGSDGVDAFRAAIERGHDDVVLAFLDAGASPNVRDGARSTPLMWAAEMGNAKLAREMVKRGADPNAADNVGWTALHHAAIGQRLEVVRVLLEAGANPAIRDLSGQAAVDLARYRRFTLRLPLIRGGGGQYPTIFDTPVRALLREVSRGK